MLSRIAESLFWIGRYVERADDTARILDVLLQILLEDPWVDEDAPAGRCWPSCRPAPPARRRGRPRATCWSCWARPDNPCSIAGALVVGPGERPRRPGDHLQRDVGVPQRHLALAAVARIAAEHRPHALPRVVRERAAVLAGLAESPR